MSLTLRRQRQGCDYAEHLIPPMTHEFSFAWDQPALSAIRLDLETGPAYMTEKTFKALHEYSSTNPSGVYEGKMWRRNRQKRAPGGCYIPTADWFLCWYGESEKPGFVSNHVVPIVLVESL